MFKLEIIEILYFLLISSEKKNLDKIFWTNFRVVKFLIFFILFLKFNYSWMEAITFNITTLGVAAISITTQHYYIQHNNFKHDTQHNDTAEQ